MLIVSKGGWGVGGVEERVLNRWDIQIEDFVTLFAVIRLSYITL